MTNEYQKIYELAKNLTDEEYTFCEEYLNNMTSPVAVSVSKALPYEENPNAKGKFLMSNPKVLEYLDLRRQQIRRTFITKDDVMLRLYQTLDKCSQPISVLDSKGHPTGEYRFDAKSATKILELLSKHFGIVDEKSANTVNIAPPINVDSKDLNNLLDKFNEEY